MARHGINETAARKLLGYHEATFYRAKLIRRNAQPSTSTADVAPTRDPI